jgi:hypothetical protein
MNAQLLEEIKRAAYNISQARYGNQTGVEIFQDRGTIEELLTAYCGKDLPLSHEAAHKKNRAVTSNDRTN